MKLTAIAPGQRVLDVGTGTGVAARAAARVAGTDGLVVGADISVGMLEVATREGGTARYLAAAAIDLPFEDATFDHVLSCFSLSHFPRYETALFDMLRVLARGGHLGVAAWGPGQDMFLQAWREVAEQFVERRMLDDAVRRALPWDELFSDAERLKNVLREAGLREILVEKREYRFPMSTEDYLAGREITASGRFVRQMLGERLWGRFRARVRETFRERFPETFTDFRDVVLAVGTKP